MQSSRSGVCCLSHMERVTPCNIASPGNSFCGQETSCHSSGHWTFRSVQSLGLRHNTIETDCLGVGRNNCLFPVPVAMHTHGAHTAAVDTAWAIYRAAPSQRVEALKADGVVTKSLFTPAGTNLCSEPLPGIGLAMRFLSSGWISR